MNQDKLTVRLQKIQQASGGTLPPNNGVLLHLEDFRKLILDMAKNGKFQAKLWLRPNGQQKTLYFKIGRERIQVKPVLTGLPLGGLALEIQ